MQIAIVGLAGSGKTTVFNTLTRGHAETGGYGGVTLNVGVVKVPDDRLDTLAGIFKPKKIVQADVTYVDLPAPPPSTEGHVGTEELPRRPPRAAARLGCAAPRRPRVRGSGRPAPGGQRRPGARPRAARPRVPAGRPRDGRAADRAAQDAAAATATPAEREAAEREDAVLRRIHAGLEAGAPIRDLALDPDDEKAIRGFRFLTQKPVLVLLNVGEGDLAAAPELVGGIAAATRTSTRMVEALSAKIEMELGELEPDEAAVFMEELGIAESGLGRVIDLSYRLLGLISFLTAGPDEVRAWPIPDGSTAVDAAGGDPHGPGQGLHPRRDGRLRGSASRSARWPRRARPAGSARRARPTGSSDGDVLEILFSR